MTNLVVFVVFALPLVCLATVAANRIYAGASGADGLGELMVGTFLLWLVLFLPGVVLAVVHLALVATISRRLRGRALRAVSAVLIVALVPAVVLPYMALQFELRPGRAGAVSPAGAIVTALWAAVVVAGLALYGWFAAPNRGFRADPAPSSLVWALAALAIVALVLVPLIAL